MLILQVTILTKPDMIEQGSESNIKNLMENIKYPIRLGWAAVKNRDKEDRVKGMTIGQGISKEADCF
jgi:hypothetical protein